MLNNMNVRDAALSGGVRPSDPSPRQTRSARTGPAAGGASAPDVLAADSAILRALGHPVRLGIMRYIAGRPETCACDFAELFGVAQPTASQHLKVLREAGLVSSRRRGTQICYSIDAGGLVAAETALASLRPAALTDAG